MTRIFLSLLIVAVCAVKCMSSSDEDYVDFSDRDDDAPEPRPRETCHYLSTDAADSVARCLQAIAQNKSNGVNDAVPIPPMDALVSYPRCAFSDGATFVNVSLDRVYASGLSCMDDIKGILGCPT
jgi:hypothetical protein